MHFITQIFIKCYYLRSLTSAPETPVNISQCLLLQLHNISITVQKVWSNHVHTTWLRNIGVLKFFYQLSIVLKLKMFFFIDLLDILRVLLILISLLK